MLLASLSFLAGGQAVAEPWHLPDWSARAVVEIPQPSTEPCVDAASVRILCQGRGKADGSDYRVLDATGKPVSFQIMFHDGSRYSLLSFRTENPRQRFFVYFGNPQASRYAEEVVLDPTPGAGPPKGGWVPRYGLVYTTIERPQGSNPRTVPDMARLIALSPTKHGARYQRRISDGYNPFGSSDYYISIYRGWVQIPTTGKYQFCTVSNEGSFSFMDGKPLVHWPGRHTVERGIHGEKNALVELSAGLHYIEYYHEEVMLEQMAFLGWRPSGDSGPFAPIPESVYTAPHAAVVRRYESPREPLLTFEPTILDTIWPVERHAGQYTRCRFQVGQAPALPPGTMYHWEFGDGITAQGPAVEHVYTALGRYSVTLRTGEPSGVLTARWPFEVYEMQHVTDEIKEGKLADYARLVRQYDQHKLAGVNLRELVHLLAESGEFGGAVKAGREYLARFGDNRKTSPRMHRLVADCALRLGKDRLDEAIADYRASLTSDMPPAEKLDVCARLIRLLGNERDAPPMSEQVQGQAKEIVKRTPLTNEVRTAYRRVVIAAGDVQLWHDKTEAAQELYERAEVLALRFIPEQVRAARVGSFPNAIREALAAGDLNAALDLVNHWEETFPTEKLLGQTFFWRGKILELRQQHDDAARYLARAVGLAVGAECESEARWLLAQALEKQGRLGDARKELAKLVASGLVDSYVQMARQKLAKSGNPPVQSTKQR
jgi:tetratricopeptide (TPR) repeat protein